MSNFASDASGLPLTIAGGPRAHVGLVLVHGAGKEPSVYYRGFVDALSAALGTQPEIVVVWWADLCNLGSEVKGADALSKQARDFRRDYLRELGVTGRGRAKADVRSLGGTLISLADTANDVVQYFFNPRLRAAVQGRLMEKVSEAGQRFDHCILVSHSLGSVIAYDMLRSHASEHNVHTWFTTGCPLAKLVKLGCVVTDVGQIAGGTLNAWQNLYDVGDVVASALATTFPFPVVDTRVENGNGILNSHNYWSNPTVAGLVADAVRARYRRLADRMPPADAALSGDVQSPVETVP